MIGYNPKHENTLAPLGERVARQCRVRACHRLFSRPHSGGDARVHAHAFYRCFEALGLTLCAILVTAVTVAARDYPPDVPQPKPAVLPAPAVKTLPNGLQVVVIERHSLPVVTLRLVVKAGGEADPPEFPGTAELVAGLLDEGTTHRTAQQIAAAIDQVGGTMDTGAEWDDSWGQVSLLVDHTALGFDLLADIIIHPTFAPAEVARIRQQALSSLEVMLEDPAYLADSAFTRLEFAGTPYGHPVDGTLGSVRRVTPEDLRQFHTRTYFPANAILAVVGDIQADEAFREAEKFFGDWSNPAKDGGAEKPSAPGGSPHFDPAGDAQAPGANPTAREIVVIDKPDAVQTEIRVGNLGVPRSSPDYYALTVANQILGGPATNRLFKALRSQRGLTYGASSDLVCLRSTGTWRAKTSTRTPETVKSVELVLDQMKRLRDHQISGWELEATEGYLTGHMALEFETSGGIAEHVLDLMIHNLPLDYWNKFPEHIRSLTTQEVWNATRQHLDPDRALIVLVGNLSGFEKDLKKLGDVRVIPVSRVDLGSDNLEQPSADAKP
ncbi:MAG TPA: pitrilysin family protein [Terriglobia bacterium]|nr:pitrilysin family protein [Terriglobia bacterium]